MTDHKPLLSVFSPTKATPPLAANRLAMWALTSSQYDYVIDYRKHGNADALSHLPNGPDKKFDIGEDGADTIRSISSHLQLHNPNVLRKETSKDIEFSTAQPYCQEGWPVYETKPSRKTQVTSDLQIQSDISAFKKVKDSLSSENGCLLYGSCVVIPQYLREKTLKLLHLGHFGIEIMKQLVGTAVYWPGIDKENHDTCKSYDS